MRARVVVLAVAGISSLFAGLMPGAAVAKGGGTPVTFYGYEEIGPHSLLADRSQGVQFMDPTCSPSFSNCLFYEFADRWDVAPTGTETDTTNVEGYVDVHAVDNFSAHTVKGTMQLTLTSTTTTWSGTFSGIFRGPNAATGSFSFVGTDGSKMTGSIAFLDDGLMSLSGQVK